MGRVSTKPLGQQEHGQAERQCRRDPHGDVVRAEVDDPRSKARHRREHTQKIERTLPGTSGFKPRIPSCLRNQRDRRRVGTRRRKRRRPPTPSSDTEREWEADIDDIALAKSTSPARASSRGQSEAAYPQLGHWLPGRTMLTPRLHDRPPH